MSLLIRKIEKAKWMQNDIVHDADISADAITNCMKTTGNTLSTWQISNNVDEEIDEAVLAIVSGHQHLDTIDVVCLNYRSLENQGIQIRLTPGKTPVKDLVDKHVDISGLTYKSLGVVANEIVQEIKQEKIIRYTKGKIKKLLNLALNKGRIQKDDLHELIRDKL